MKVKSVVLAFVVSLVCLFSVTQAELTDNLVGYWKLDENPVVDGTTIFPTVGTLGSFKSFDQDPATNNAMAGKINGSIRFDYDLTDILLDQGDYITLSNPEYLNPGTEDFTVAFWMYTGVTTATQTLAHKGNRASDNSGWGLFYSRRDNFGRFIFRVNSGGGPLYKTEAIAEFPRDTAWHFCVAVIDRDASEPLNDVIRVYADFDGDPSKKAEQSIAGFPSIDSEESCFLGATRNAGDVLTAPLWGNLDEFAVWDRALGDAEVAALFNSGAGVELLPAAEWPHRYDGSTDPVLLGWVPSASDPNVTYGPVTDDQGTGLNAWNINDNLSTAGSILYYQSIPTGTEKAQAAVSGWLFRAKVRVVNAPDTEDFGITLEYSDGSVLGKRFMMLLGAEADGDPIVSFYGGATVVLDGYGPGYHLYELSYNPSTESVSLYVDSQADPVATDVDGLASGSFNRIAFGAMSNGMQGNANYNLVEWVPYPKTDLTGDGSVDMADFTTLAGDWLLNVTD